MATRGPVDTERSRRTCEVIGRTARGDRIAGLDHIKAAAIVAVLMTHAVPGFFDRPITPTELAVFALTGFHVPSFLFVAGFLSRAGAPVGWRDVADRWRRLLVPYFVATAIIWLLGLVTFPTPRKFVFKIVTGGAFGLYYFVPVLAFCFLWLPVVSRLRNRTLLALAVLLAMAAQAMWAHPAWRFSDNIYWNVRDPILQFHLGHFLLGVIAARYRRDLMDVGSRAGVLVTGAAAAGIAAYAWLATTAPAEASQPIARTGYTLLAITFLATLARGRAAPRFTRFLSDTTLTLYLYHWFAYLAVMPLLSETLPLGLRIPVLTSAGLAFGTLVVLVGRSLLGRYSRPLLGA